MYTFVVMNNFINCVCVSGWYRVTTNKCSSKKKKKWKNEKQIIKLLLFGSFILFYWYVTDAAIYIVKILYRLTCQNHIK